MAFARSCLQAGKSAIFINLTRITRPVVIPHRGIRYGYANYERIMKSRRKIAGPERVRRRSEWMEWNYEAEIFAFPKRLHEEISESTLKIAFTNPSYIVEEERKRTELGVPVHDVPLNLIPNTHLIDIGLDILTNYIKSFVRYALENLPEEGVIAIKDYLMSVNTLAHVSSNIGTKELILTAEFPVSDNTLADTFKAIIGAIVTDCSQKRAELFVQDFLCTQLIGKDVLEMWDIVNPLEVVNNMLKKSGRALAEPRLVFESGRNTLEPIFLVALYSDKVFLGKGPGESLSTAVEMAAQDSLRRLLGLKFNEKPLPFGKHGHEIELNSNEEHNTFSNVDGDKLLEHSS